MNYLMQNRRLSKFNWFAFTAMVMLLCMTMGCTALRPQASLPSDKQSPLYIPPTLVPAVAATATSDATDPLNAQDPDCTNDLKFINDLTLPDGSFVKAGATLDKQWEVKNSGSCNWNETYSIRLINGPELGATSPQTITPLRSGVKGTLRIEFTAPSDPGNYVSTWQAFSPDGKAFGEYFSIEINVTEN